MDRLKKELFIQLQFSMLFSALTVLPEFDFMQLLFDYNFNLPMIACKIIATITGGGALYQLYAMQGSKHISTGFMAISGLGLIIVLVSAIGLPIWMEYAGLILLIIALCMSEKSLHIKWKERGTQGAYLISMAVLLYIFDMIGKSFLTHVAALVGLIIYLVGLKKIKVSLDSAGLAGVTKLTIAVALCIIGILFRFVPWIGTVVTVTLATLAFIVQYSGYCSLRNSLAIGTEGQRGAANLKTNMILLVIGALTILIPEYGLTISAFISMISIWLLYLGWKRIMFGIETSAEGIEEMY